MHRVKEITEPCGDKQKSESCERLLFYFLQPFSLFPANNRQLWMMQGFMRVRPPGKKFFTQLNPFSTLPARIGGGGYSSTRDIPNDISML